MHGGEKPCDERFPRRGKRKVKKEGVYRLTVESARTSSRRSSTSPSMCFVPVPFDTLTETLSSCINALVAQGRRVTIGESLPLTWYFARIDYFTLNGLRILSENPSSRRTMNENFHTKSSNDSLRLHSTSRARLISF